MDVFSYTAMSLTRNGRPWLPVMGEMHFSRVAPEMWEPNLVRMKSGGVEIVSTYLFWLHHEEIKGQEDWTGCRDLRQFLTLVKKHGLYCFLRVGPWAHGEARNGGLPDWLVRESEAEGFRLRSNDPGYLRYADRWIEAIGREAADFVAAKGGPVIGVQIENEYGHAGGLSGPEAEAHMEHLLQAVKRAGLEVPYYTATGWGGAVTHGLMPVMGGYCDAPWDSRLTKIETSTNFLFRAERDDHAIAADWAAESGDGDTSAHSEEGQGQFPYLTAELGGGIMPTRHRRPIASGRDAGCMSLVKIGSGASLLGYYMYCGGTNPPEKATTLQESKATGYPNDLPVLSYDFQAPIGECGQLRDGFREIRLLASFAKDFGEDLCRMPYVPQLGNPSDPEDTDRLRTAARFIQGPDGPQGYLFVSNYARLQERRDIAGYVPAVTSADGSEIVRFPQRITVPKDAYFFFPFGMPLGRAVIRSATAVPLMMLRNAKTLVFYSVPGIEPEFGITGDPDGWRILVLTRDEALRAAKVSRGETDYLVIAEDGDILTDEAIGLEIRVRDAVRPRITVYPEPSESVLAAGWTVCGRTENGTAYEYSHVLRNTAACGTEEITRTAAVKVRHPEMSEAARGFLITCTRDNSAEPEAADTILSVLFDGDIAEMHTESARPEAPVTHGMLSDCFNLGTRTPWEIRVPFGGNTGYPAGRNTGHPAGGCPEAFTADILIEPLHEDTPVYMEERPVFDGDGTACRIREIHADTVYQIPVID